MLKLLFDNVTNRYNYLCGVYINHKSHKGMNMITPRLVILGTSPTNPRKCTVTSADKETLRCSQVHVFDYIRYEQVGDEFNAFDVCVLKYK